VEKIGPKTITETLKMVEELLMTYQGKINRAFDQQENALAVGFKINFALAKDKIALKCSIDFTESKVKDFSECLVDEKQLPLPLDGLEDDLEDGDSVTFSHGDRSVTLTGKRDRIKAA